MDELKKYGLVRYSTKTGKVDTAMTALGCGLLQLWGLQNTTKTKTTVVFELESGLIRSRYTGTDRGFPEVERAIEDKCEYMEEHIRACLAEEDKEEKK